MYYLYSPAKDSIYKHKRYGFSGYDKSLFGGNKIDFPPHVVNSIVILFVRPPLTGYQKNSELKSENFQDSPFHQMVFGQTVLPILTEK